MSMAQAQGKDPADRQLLKQGSNISPHPPSRLRMLHPPRTLALPQPLSNRTTLPHQRVSLTFRISQQLYSCGPAADSECSWGSGFVTVLRSYCLCYAEGEEQSSAEECGWVSVDSLEGRLAIGQTKDTIRVHRWADDTTQCLSLGTFPACVGLTRNQLLLPLLLLRVRPAEDHLQRCANVRNSLAALAGSHNSDVSSGMGGPTMHRVQTVANALELLLPALKG